MLDLVFPIFCLGCRKEGVWLCDECRLLIPLANIQTCPICRKNTIDGNVCERCKSKSYLSNLKSFGFYHDPILQGLTTNLKYYNAKILEQYIEKFILRFLNKYSFNFENDLVIPIPLHRKKLWLRGFNQAQIIANIFAKYYNLELREDVLKRKWNTEEQTKVSKEERLNNVIDAFICKNCKEILNRNIILIDDVYTTGTTMQECAKILCLAGAKDVKGVVLARG